MEQLLKWKGYGILVVILDVHKGHILVHANRGLCSLFLLLQYQGHELLDQRHFDISSVIPGNNHLELIPQNTKYLTLKHSEGSI